MANLRNRAKRHVAKWGEFSLDFEAMELWHGDRLVSLTLREFRVLKYLVSRPRTVVTRQRLIGSAWPKRKRSSFRTVDNCISRLRQKIESNTARPVLIQTVHGVGYRFVPMETIRSK